jgi:hypothetical protein
MMLPPEFLSAPIAHRALHDAEQGIPENSRGAVQRAVRAGYGIEIDVHLSADGRRGVPRRHARPADPRDGARSPNARHGSCRTSCPEGQR